MNQVTIYQEAKQRAARTMTLRLQRQEDRLTAQARRRRLDDRELAQLAAIRAELRARGAPGSWRRSFPVPWLLGLARGRRPT